MKITNLTKLIIRFLGGGIINFPTKHLKEIEIEPFDGEGGSSVDLTTLEFSDIEDEFKQFILERYNDSEFRTLLGDADPFKYINDESFIDNLVFPTDVGISKYVDNMPTPYVKHDLYWSILFGMLLYPDELAINLVYNNDNVEEGKYYFCSDYILPHDLVYMHEFATEDNVTYYDAQLNVGG